MAMKWQNIVALVCIALVGCAIGYREITAQPSAGTIVLYRGTIWGLGYDNGGADIDNNGNLRTKGSITVDGTITAGSGSEVLTNADGTLKQGVLEQGGATDAQILTWDDGAGTWSPAGTTNLASGTVSNSTLYWDGSSWAEDTTVRTGATGLVSVGSNDSSVGQIAIYGPSGTGQGGTAFFHTAADDDTNVDSYKIQTWQGDLEITAGATDLLVWDDVDLTAGVKQNWTWDSAGDAVEVGRENTTGGTGSGGMVHLYDDASGSTDPGFVHFESANGTSWYLFVENDGTLKTSSTVPINNTDGSEVGPQS